MSFFFILILESEWTKTSRTETHTVHTPFGLLCIPDLPTYTQYSCTQAIFHFILLATIARCFLSLSLPQIHMFKWKAYKYTQKYFVYTYSQKESENALLFIILRQYQFSIHRKFPRVGTICTCESVACFKIK